MNVLPHLSQPIKVCVQLALAFLLLIAGGLCVIGAQVMHHNEGLEIRALISGTAIERIGKLQQAPSSKTALSALAGLSTAVKQLNELSDKKMMTEQEYKARQDMRVILAKNLVPVPNETCTDAVFCWQMDKAELPESVVNQISEVFKKSSVRESLSNLHGEQVSELAMEPSQFTVAALRVMYAAFMGLLILGGVFCFGFHSRKSTEK